VASIQSSNANGANVGYSYDELNRLSTVVDNRLTGNNTTSYAYDPANNLTTATYPTAGKNFTYDADSGRDDVQGRKAAQLAHRLAFGHYLKTAALMGEPYFAASQRLIGERKELLAKLRDRDFHFLHRISCTFKYVRIRT
jgi:YD repeat-containing protein